MLSVLHICPDFSNTALYDLLISSLVKNEINNIVYVPTKESINETFYKLEFFGKEFNLLDRLIFFRKQDCIYNDLKRKEYLTDINIVHAHTLFSAGYTAYQLYKKYHIPYIVAVRNADINVFFKYMIHLRRLGIRILCNARKIIFLSPAYRDLVLSKYVPVVNRNKILDKSIVIPNGINDFFLNNLYYRSYQPDRCIKLLYVGEIDKNKNITTSILACLELKKKGYNVLFSIVGKVKEPDLMNIIKRYDFIHYYMPCVKEQVIKHMRDADIFVMPSITETFGLVYPEAMSQGMPIIYSKGQGFDGYFEQGKVGYSVKCFDYKDLAERVIDICNDYTRISRCCVDKVNRFNWMKISLEYKNIYQLYNHI